jgi:hypothetical protein
MNKFHVTLVFLSLVVAGLPSVGDEVSLKQMRKRCEEARELEIAPLREAAIEECVSTRRTTRTRTDCERLYSDFGEGGGTVTGGFRPGMFNDLPECVEYFEVRNRQGTDRSRR